MALPADETMGREEATTMAELVTSPVSTVPTLVPTAKQIVKVPVLLPPEVIPGGPLNIQYNGQTYNITCPKNAISGETIIAQIDVSPAVQPAVNPIILIETISANADRFNLPTPVLVNRVIETAGCLLKLTVINWLLSWGTALGFPTLFVAMVLNCIACVIARNNADSDAFNRLRISFRCGIAASILVFAGLVMCIVEDIIPFFYCPEYTEYGQDCSEYSKCRPQAGINTYCNFYYGDYGYGEMGYCETCYGYCSEYMPIRGQWDCQDRCLNSPGDEQGYDRATICTTMRVFTGVAAFLAAVQFVSTIEFLRRLQTLRIKMGEASWCC